MSYVLILAGVSIVSFLLLYFMQQLKPEHETFRMFLMFIFFTLLMLIPNVVSDSTNQCQVLLNKTETIYKYGNNFSGYHWDYSSPPKTTAATEGYLFHTNETYTYGTYCYPMLSVTSTLFFRIITWLLRIFWVYVTFYMFYFWYKKATDYFGKK